MMFDMCRPVFDQLVHKPPCELAKFMQHAMTEAHMYGSTNLRDWLLEQYGLTHEQSLEIALEILTANGAESIAATRQP